MAVQEQSPDLGALKAELRRLRQYLWGRAADAQAAGEETMVGIPPAEYVEFAKTLTKAIAWVEAASSIQAVQQSQTDAAIQRMVQNAAAKQSGHAAAKPA